jgi:4-hydroxybutyrate dehydrogenase
MIAMSTISCLIRIEFGEGEVRWLAEFLALLGVKRPLIATDRGLASTGWVERVAGLLDSVPVVFDSTPAN